MQVLIVGPAGWQEIAVRLVLEAVVGLVVGIVGGRVIVWALNRLGLPQGLHAPFVAVGALVGYIAFVIRHEFTLVLVGGVFVAEAVSVLIQRYWFKYTRLRYGEGRRIFLMAPIHHHFQRKGWTETQVVIRFWLIGAILAAMAIATVKLR